MRCASRTGFTLVEILIVVVILGILAAIVVPSVWGASDEAKIANLMMNLKAVREQIQLYKLQHGDNYPTNKIINQMTLYSNAAGNTRAKPKSTFPYGPYLSAFPENSVSGLNSIRVKNDGSTAFNVPNKDKGWWYNTVSGEFRADLTNAHVDSNGTPLNQL